MGEETAVEAMKAGAHDYVMKGNLERLTPAIRRELREAKIRKEHVRAEDKIKFQATLLDQFTSAAVATDLADVIFYWNKFAETVYGWRSEEVLGKKTLDIIIPEHSVALTKELRNCVDRVGSAEAEIEFQRKDGSNATYSPFRFCFTGCVRESSRQIRNLNRYHKAQAGRGCAEGERAPLDRSPAHR